MNVEFRKINLNEARDQWIFRQWNKNRYIPLKEIYHMVKKVFKNDTGVRDIPDLLVCTPPKAGTTNWSKVLWQLKYLNDLGILVDKDDLKYINYTNLYKDWLRKISKNFEISEKRWKTPDFSTIVSLFGKSVNEWKIEKNIDCWVSHFRNVRNKPNTITVRVWFHPKSSERNEFSDFFGGGKRK